VAARRDLLGQAEVEHLVLLPGLSIDQGQGLAPGLPDAEAAHRGAGPASYAGAVDELGSGGDQQVGERVALVDVCLACHPVAREEVGGDLLRVLAPDPGDVDATGVTHDDAELDRRRDRVVLATRESTRHLGEVSCDHPAWRGVAEAGQDPQALAVRRPLEERDREVLAGGGLPVASELRLVRAGIRGEMVVGELAGDGTVRASGHAPERRRSAGPSGASGGSLWMRPLVVGAVDGWRVRRRQRRDTTN
jgi:hypothetical protein